MSKIEKEMQAANRIAQSLVEEEWKRSMGNPSDPSVTWLDQCAWHALIGILAGRGEGRWFQEDPKYDAQFIYDIAAAMLVEKRKREGGAS